MMLERLLSKTQTSEQAGSATDFAAPITHHSLPITFLPGATTSADLLEHIQPVKGVGDGDIGDNLPDL
jgi:hypothetical protein